MYRESTNHHDVVRFQMIVDSATSKCVLELVMTRCVTPLLSTNTYK